MNSQHWLLARQAFLLLLTAAAPLTVLAAPRAQLETGQYRLELSPANGEYQLLDKASGVVWRSNPHQSRFGEVTLVVDGKAIRQPLSACEIHEFPDRLEAMFRPDPNQSEAAVTVFIRRGPDERSLDFSYVADKALTVQSLRLLDEAFWATEADRGSAVIPAREGLLIPAGSGKPFRHSFDTYAYEGCHLTMAGMVKRGTALLVSWEDPNVTAEVHQEQPIGGRFGGRDVLSLSLVLRRSAANCRISLLGRGDYNEIGQAYREMARERGLLVTWDQKLKRHPERARLFGAINFKLWSTLDRQMNEDSSKEAHSRVNWTFEEAAQVAEHLKQDLQLDKVFFLMGGWIRRGYDNQHPDILPAAPECGGDFAFQECAGRVRRLGYLFGLHDNYQDMYRDAPSWDESYLMRTPDGNLAKGGVWAGGRAYLTCSQKALELAQRPQNLPAVKRLTGADAYFIDTTYASGLMECHDPQHPLDRAGDMKWKQALSDYARSQFSIFGSECGREWAIPHSDFFEGLTGVSGHAYHNENLERDLGATVIPLFELVYRDTIAMYGKYGYDPANAAPYVLQHLILGRTLNYHNIPAHLYWKEPISEQLPLALQPGIDGVAIKAGPGARVEVRLTYAWRAEATPTKNYRVLAHFTDADGKILFQGDYEPAVPTSQWQPGQIYLDTSRITLPEGFSGRAQLRLGLFQEAGGQRVRLRGPDDGERRHILGELTADGHGSARFAPVAHTGTAPGLDPGLFVRGDKGWPDGLHPMDRFVKNTYEILSPLNELTSRQPLTRHEFLTADRKVQHSVFGTGEDRTEVFVNFGSANYRCRSRYAGDVQLPPYGFLVESPTFAAFHALNWKGVRYAQAPLFALRSLDNRPLDGARKVRVYHGFGDARVHVLGSVREVDREAVVTRAK